VRGRVGVIISRGVRLQRMKTSLPAGIEVLLDAAKTIYVCPMDPEFVSDTPGACPKCHMRLEPKPAANVTDR
jgi:hypothetical protein